MQQYEFSVFGENGVGRGASSNPIEAQTLEMAPSSAPRVQARALSLNSILVRWTPPDKPNGLITVCQQLISNNMHIFIFRVTKCTSLTLSHRPHRI